MISRVGSNLEALSQQVSENNKEKRTQAQSVQQSKETDKAETLKKSIQNGEYKVDVNKTAEKIAEELL